MLIKTEFPKKSENNAYKDVETVAEDKLHFLEKSTLKNSSIYPDSC